MASAFALALHDVTLVRAGRAVVRPTLSAAAPVRPAGLTMTYELGGLAGVAEVTSAGSAGVSTCARTTPERLVCKPLRPLGLGPQPITGVFPLTVAGRGAPGDQGEIAVTLSAAGARPITGVVTVRIAEPVGLAAVKPPRVTAAPGAAVDLPATVRVTGATPVAGVSVRVADEWALQPRATFRNCRYSAGRLRSCRFDQTLRAGVAYRMIRPYRLRADSYAPTGFYSEQSWLTAAEPGVARLDRVGAPGTGPELRLAALPATRARPQADPDRADNATFTEVVSTGRNGFDLTPVASTARGSVTVGVRNRGPATLDLVRAGENAATADVILPGGTTAASVPTGCRRVAERRFHCVTSYFLRADTQQTFTFRITGEGGPAGSVTVSGPGIPDVAPGNDRARLTVTAGQGAGGPTLPITGPDAGLLAVFGLLLLTAGCAAVSLTLGRSRPGRGR